MTSLLRVRTTAGVEFLCTGLSAVTGELEAPVFQLDMPDGDRLFVSATRLRSVELYEFAGPVENPLGTRYDCPPVPISPDDAEALGAAMARVGGARTRLVAVPEGTT